MAPSASNHKVNHQWSINSELVSPIIFCLSVKGCFSYTIGYASPHLPILVHAAAAKSRQSCQTLCDPRDGSPPGSSVHGIFQARVLEWIAIAFPDFSPLKNLMEATNLPPKMQRWKVWQEISGGYWVLKPLLRTMIWVITCLTLPNNFKVIQTTIMFDFQENIQKTAFISIIICIENFWNHIQEIMNHGSFWEKGLGSGMRGRFTFFHWLWFYTVQFFFIMYKNIF